MNDSPEKDNSIKKYHFVSKTDHGKGAQYCTKSSLVTRLRYQKVLVSLVSVTKKITLFLSALFKIPLERFDL